MVTIFGKTVYKVLLEFKEGKRLVSPIYTFEYTKGKIYKKKSYEPGYYSWKTKLLAKEYKELLNKDKKLTTQIYKCRIPLFSIWRKIGPNEIISEKIKIIKKED